MAFSVQQFDAQYGTTMNNNPGDVSWTQGAPKAIAPTSMQIDYAAISVILLVVLIVLALVILLYVKRTNGAQHGTV